MSSMRIALVHDWFTGVGGAERVLMRLHTLFPEAPVYLLVGNRDLVSRWMPDAQVIYSPLQRIPFATTHPRALLSLMPSAVESLDVSSYDLVISSSVLFSKGLVVRPGTRHLCYCYSPSRPLWDRTHAPEYRGMLGACARHLLRLWDSAAAQRPDLLIAPSEAVRDRIQKWYRRDAIVIPPPARLGDASFSSEPYLLLVGRLTPHKHIEPVLDAFSKLRDTLVVVGQGPLERSLRARAGKNVRLTGWVDDQQLADLYARATAVIVASSEDWGLTAVEAMSYGKPVLALREGGSLETVAEGVTGEFFDDAIPEAIADGVKRIRQLASRSDPAQIARHARAYGQEAFDRRILSMIQTI